MENVISEWVYLGRNRHELVNKGITIAKMTEKDSVTCSKCRGRLLRVDIGMGLNAMQCGKCDRTIIY